MLAALPECEPGYADGRLDLAHGCADGVCAGATYDEMVAKLGDPVDCTVFDFDFDGYESHGLQCTWSDGLGATFDDDDQDGVPDGTAPYSLSVDPPFDGGTADGLSLNASVSCFVDALGQPTDVDFELGDDGVWYPDIAQFDQVAIYDWYGKNDVPGHDGYVDSLSLYAP